MTEEVLEENELEETAHNDVRSARKISKESAERILVKVLRQSGFQTEEEINVFTKRPSTVRNKNGKERPLKKVKRNELDSNEKPLASAKIHRRGKKEGPPKALPFGRDWNESDWNMKLRVEPRVRNVTEAPVDEHGGLAAAANSKDSSNFDSRKTEVKRSVVDGNRRKENFSMSPEENNAPNMVPKPWW
uniref:Uncharacterized protein n=1 Tax=Globodera rostochiensis TaxID=31243 RepID=A0A914HFQ0_GLORO